MTAKKPAADRPDVTLYPTGEAWIADVEPVEQTVSAERADELLAYQPAAFTTDKPPEVPRETSATDSPTETQPSPDAGATTEEAHS